MRFESLLKKIVRTGVAAAENGIKAVKSATIAVETAIAEAKAEEERKQAAEAEAARKREEEKKAAAEKAARAEAVRREAARRKREAALLTAVLAETEALGIASANPPAKKAGGKRTAAKASSKKGEAGNAPAKKAASKATRTIARENAALAARPAPEAHPYEPAEPNRDYAKAQGNFNANSGLAFIRSQILRIVNMEGPISEPMLLVRVLDEWGFSDLDKLRYRIVRMAVPGVLPVTDRLGVPVYWPVGVGPGDWNCYRFPSDANRPQRVFATIPLEEIAAAIVAEHHASSGDRPIDDYVPGALERLGLSRDVSPDMGETLEVAKLLAQGIDDRPSANTSVPDEWNEAAAKAEEAERRKKEEEEAAERREEEEEAERQRIEAEENEKREKAAVSFWAARLAEHPEEAELFDSWSELSPEDWILLLSKQPRFARRCRWDELPEHAVNRIVALRPELRRYKPRDVTFEGEKGEEITIHYDDAAAERGIEALGSASFWNAFAAQQNSESDDNGGDPPPPED